MMDEIDNDPIKDTINSFKNVPGESKVSALLMLLDEVTNRVSWDEYFIMIASFIKKRSSCDRLQVGCVITKNNRVLCTGYNGHVPGAPHTSKVVDNHEQMTIHAEVNAICHAAKDGISLSESKAYVTHYPCINCAKSLIAAGITEVVYLTNYKTDPIATELFLLKGIKIYQVGL
jgi:dCMP deaminase